jgi:hypothetical protein
VRDGQWQPNIGPAHFGTDVHGKTLGIVGMGRIGEAWPGAHRGFGMPVLYHSQRANPRWNTLWRARSAAWTPAAAGGFRLPDGAADRQHRRADRRAGICVDEARSNLVNISRGRWSMRRR